MDFIPGLFTFCSLMERGVFLEEKYMRRAIELARNGTGRVNPNPLVGAVIVKNGNIIAEGYHEEYGGLHAERNAFKNLKESAKGADIYVTLEPCCHYGKQPPCTQAVIENGIRNVYIGSDDPNSLVAGKGIEQLKAAGINVVTGVLKKECDALNTVFFHYITNKTPYVVMKYAMTLDGKTACDTGESKWVTGEEARQHVQQSRNALQGIMAGVAKVKDCISKVAKVIRDHLPHSPAKTGPLKDLNKVKIVETIASTIKPMPLANAMNKSLGIMTSGLKANIGRIGTGGGITFVVHYSPTISMPQNTNKDEFSQLLKKHKDEVELAKLELDEAKTKGLTKKEKKEIEIVQGDGKGLNISPVENHINDLGVLYKINRKSITYI